MFAQFFVLLTNGGMIGTFFILNIDWNLFAAISRWINYCFDTIVDRSVWCVSKVASLFFEWRHSSVEMQVWKAIVFHNVNQTIASIFDNLRFFESIKVFTPRQAMEKRKYLHRSSYILPKTLSFKFDCRLKPLPFEMTKDFYSDTQSWSIPDYDFRKSFRFGLRSHHDVIAGKHCEWSLVSLSGLKLQSDWINPQWPANVTRLVTKNSS